LSKDDEQAMLQLILREKRWLTLKELREWLGSERGGDVSNGVVFHVLKRNKWTKETLGISDSPGPSSEPST
jgi:transposase